LNPSTYRVGTPWVRSKIDAAPGKVLAPASPVFEEEVSERILPIGLADIERVLVVLPKIGDDMLDRLPRRRGSTCRELRHAPVEILGKLQAELAIRRLQRAVLRPLVIDVVENTVHANRTLKQLGEGR
jgi:hypothetical protein